MTAYKCAGLIPHTERARKFAELHERKKIMIKRAVTDWEKKLILRTNGTSVLDSLRNMGLSNDLEKIAKVGPQKLLKERNINKRNLTIIASLLLESGYIKNAEDWIDSTPKRLTRCPHCSKEF